MLWFDDDPRFVCALKVTVFWAPAKNRIPHSFKSTNGTASEYIVGVTCCSYIGVTYLAGSEENQKDRCDSVQQTGDRVTLRSAFGR